MTVTSSDRPVGTGGLAVSAWSAVSPYGIGRDAFAAGIGAGRSAVAVLDRAAYPGPFDRAGLVPDFSPAAQLGRKGTRTMDRATGLSVTLVQQLLAGVGPDVTAGADELGLVLGTGSGSVQSTMDFTRDSLTAPKPYHVDPARFPNTVMNRAAGQSAIWHRITGPNVTVAGGAATGLLALSYAARLLRGGHCRRVLSGAVEEYSQARAWLDWHGRGEGTRALAEGGALVLLEEPDAARRAGRAPLATLLATRFMAVQQADQEPEQARVVLARCITAALRSAGLPPQAVGLVAPGGVADGLADQEDAAIADALGGPPRHVVRCRDLVGDAAAASAAFQIAAVLAVASRYPDAGTGLVTTIDPHGLVGCALLRLTATGEAACDATGDAAGRQEGDGHAAHR